MIKTRILKYTVIYTEEPEGGFTVTVPALPGCVTYGRDLNEAKKMAQDAISLYLESLNKHKEAIPTEENSFISSINLDTSFALPVILRSERAPEGEKDLCSTK